MLNLHNIMQLLLSKQIKSSLSTIKLIFFVRYYLFFNNNRLRVFKLALMEVLKKEIYKMSQNAKDVIQAVNHVIIIKKIHVFHA